MLLGCLLQVSPDQDGGGRCGEDSLLTPCWVYCYTCIPFGLCNTGTTFQRLMHIALGRQLRRNTEAYVDDIVVKSREVRTLIQDLEETFASLH